ncbi:MAG: hypothetical protein U1G07_24785 [Verrucomicrobiota bacterium]
MRQRLGLLDQDWPETFLRPWPTSPFRYDVGGASAALPEELRVALDRATAPGAFGFERL